MENKPCSRCKAEDAPLTLRHAAICVKCFTEYVQNKCVRRLAALLKDTRTSKAPQPRRYVAGLSFGPSSSALTHCLNQQATYHGEKKSSSPFEPYIVHVDTNLSTSPSNSGQPSAAEELIAKYRLLFPALKFACIPLKKALDVSTIDWSALPLGQEGSPNERLVRLFNNLPSATARVDMMRLLIRHILVHVALEGSYSALLLGHNTTTLAALTLSEVANGRGFSIPWHVNDGEYPITTFGPAQASEGEEKATFPIYHPLREILSNEIWSYIRLMPGLESLVYKEEANSVVSHKEQSIEDVMTRYFQGVEGPHSGIVANVVRTTGKLDRVYDASMSACGLCGMPLDNSGDTTWAGEMGEAMEGDSSKQRLCYGCKRTVEG